MNNYNWLLFSFKGRINRKTFWLFQLFMMAVVVALLMMLGGDLLDRLKNPDDVEAFNELMDLAWKINLVFLWPKLAVDVKRFQDRNKAWYWVLIQLIPMIGPIWYLIDAGFMPGTAGENRFGTAAGPNPPPSGGQNQSGESGHFDA
ncbi:DUF805 domain-containing protein [Echinimonas agarilytica]|uniref:DUF805 domain-containing protein n=1 Tax=Echinimonas agarilytica TaxID=1215918 RepID=A0AA42B658_9GAMM|nr:DUF805 domain-containing protein [Echinimonas agarilytica]MCM2678264.1 DUF805 domain-containing protein [Echinimonas agarilytica]